jgi:trans-aconitate 2-methyltransferase
MPTWNPDQYLKFAGERTQACRDLAARISLPAPRRIIDLGCGPGNSTEVLAARWPDAELTGFDSSPEMLSAARQALPSLRWILGDILQWAASGDASFDVVFSNAALHWVSDHARLFPQLLRRVAPGGALAVQMPSNHDGPAHRLMREIAASPAWRRSFPAGRVREWYSHDLNFYYNTLAPQAARLDLWETEYVHVFPNAAGIVEWYRSTGMRPFLEALETETERQRFAGEYLEGIRALYPPRPDGRVLFPFRRLFVVAYRPFP